jgi:hypothetical protein
MTTSVIILLSTKDVARKTSQSLTLIDKNQQWHWASFQNLLLDQILQLHLAPTNPAERKKITSAANKRTTLPIFFRHNRSQSQRKEEGCEKLDEPT